MAVNVQALLDAPIIELDTIDSTNNYAMRLIDADTALPGMTIITRSQEKGKGQHGKHWFDEPGSSLLMSIIIKPNFKLDSQFVFNACVAVAIADVLTDLYEHWRVNIKWPNDIVIDDKKAGGVLIENVVRGSNWAYSVIGLGLNVLQASMPSDIPYATSLKMTSGKDISILELRTRIRERIIKYAAAYTSGEKVIEEYNNYLYKRGEQQEFIEENSKWSAEVKGVVETGLLALMLTEKNIRFLRHGEAIWVWKGSASKEPIHE